MRGKMCCLLWVLVHLLTNTYETPRIQLLFDYPISSSITLICLSTGIVLNTQSLA